MYRSNGVYAGSTGETDCICARIGVYRKYCAFHIEGRKEVAMVWKIIFLIEILVFLALALYQQYIKWKSEDNEK